MYTDSIFLFCVQSATQCTTEYEASIAFGPYRFCYTNGTPVNNACCGDRELLVFGLAVDVRDGVGDNLASKILTSTCTLQDVIDYDTFLGGKYILLYKDSTGVYAIPDATASIPFCYTLDSCPLVCAADSEQIAKILDLQPDAELLKVRNSGDISQAMPYDLTVYKNIAQLLPNHYFSFLERRAVRFVNYDQKQSPLSYKKAAELTAPFISNILQYYKQHFKLYCPLTSGWDSRVVLAVMLSKEEAVATYTIRHDNFSENEPDIVIPQKIAEQFAVSNIQIPDLLPSANMLKIFDDRLGATGYSKRTLMIANTIKSSYGDGAVINGDIIGQVGKCSLHRDIPETLATARYFRCKLHNYSKESLYQLNRWIKDIKDSGEKVNLFDLFSIESRMGRWAAQENLIYGMIGQNYLNIFNSRSIIYQWIRVSRKHRKLSKIHQQLIAITYPELMGIPVGGDMSIFEKISKLNGLTYYLAGFVKFYFEKFCFMRKKQKGG